MPSIPAIESTAFIKSGIFSSGVSYGNAGGNGSIQALPSNSEGSGGGGGCGGVVLKVGHHQHHLLFPGLDIRHHTIR